MRVVDFDPANHGADDLLHAGPIKVGKPRCHLGGEIFQTTDEEREFAFVLSHFDRRLVSLLKLGKALFQASDTRFEFRLVDDAFGVAIDQPADAATQAGYLSLQADDGRSVSVVTRPARES